MASGGQREKRPKNTKSIYETLISANDSAADTKAKSLNNRPHLPQTRLLQTSFHDINGSESYKRLRILQVGKDHTRGQRWMEALEL